MARTRYDDGGFSGGTLQRPALQRLLADIRTGRIDEVLASLTAYARTTAQLRTLVFDAFFYPGVVLLFAGVLFGIGPLTIIPP